MIRKNINLLILSLFTLVVSISILKIVFTPMRDYGLFLSGLYNILSNYIFLLSILGFSLFLYEIKKNKYYFIILSIFFSVFILTQISFNIILELIFYHKLDLIFGFDKFPLTILYLLNICIGFLLWFIPFKNLVKYLITIIFSFVSSMNIGLNDIEVFSIKSFANYPGGNVFILVMLIGLFLYLFKLINRKYINIGSKIFGSWMVVISLISCIFSLIY
tara:strand:- start:1688 stop:2341 length:654 start_codon:yes stop_codon:yes gene_type:complete